MASKWYVYETLEGEYKITDAPWDEVQKIPRKSVKGFKTATEAGRYLDEATASAGGMTSIGESSKQPTGVVGRTRVGWTVEDTVREAGESAAEVGSIEEEWSRCKGKYDALIYVDGSYRSSDINENEAGFGQPGSLDGSFSYGMIVVNDDGVQKFAECFEPDENYSPHRNVAGEIKGAMAAMQYALDQDFKKIIIRYDYNGIEYWASGDKSNGGKVWKANKPATIEYQKFYNEISQHLTIHFAHVTGHTGNEGNEECDRLAKEKLWIGK